MVQPDAGLVENIEHIHQLRSDLGGQADALRFASRQGAGGPVEREIVKSHIEQKLQPGTYLFHHFTGNLRLPFGEPFFNIFEKEGQFADIEL